MNIDGADVHVEGDGDQVIVMVHGWPDTYRLWDAQVAFLRDRYKCVRFTLPGFDLDRERRAYSIDEVAEFMRRSRAGAARARAGCSRASPPRPFR